jgi:hypothetical protein
MAARLAPHVLLIVQHAVQGVRAVSGALEHLT